MARALVVGFVGLLALADSPPPSERVDINQASLEQLAKIPGISRARAKMIVRIRDQNGPFKEVEELRALPRLAERTFQQLREYLVVSSEASESRETKALERVGNGE